MAHVRPVNNSLQMLPERFGVGYVETLQLTKLFINVFLQSVFSRVAMGDLDEEHR